MKLEPGNAKLRKEYQELTKAKNEKEKMWYSKMSGFLDSDRLKKIEERDKENQDLRYKIHRQSFRENENSNPNLSDQYIIDLSKLRKQRFYSKN